MKIKTNKEFSGVPKGTTGTAEFEQDSGDWKITWDLPRSKPLSDWFTEEEFQKYLEKI